MSTDAPDPGGKAALAALAAEATGLVRDAAAEEQDEQLELLEPLSAEETAEAQEELGPNAGPLAVMRKARENRKGRKPGSKNRNSADTVNYLSQFGPDPGVALMRIIGEPEEAMIARSHQLDPSKKKMSFAEARAMRIRAAETMMPYFHGKKPLAIDANITGVMLVEQVGGHPGDDARVIDGVVGVAIEEDGEDPDA